MGYQGNQLGLSQDASSLRWCCGVCMRVCMREKGEVVWLKKKVLGEERHYRHICRKICRNLHYIILSLGLLSIVKVQLVDINKILPFLLSKMTLELSQILKHN